jgi:predicted nucleic acid-binding protein
MILLETSVISESLKLPVGERKETLHLGLEQRIPPFDASASQAYADILSTARAQGRAISTVDGYIAATAKRHGFMVATRDASPFEAAGVTVINPWTVQH